jgi:glutamyl-tRNA reductase
MQLICLSVSHHNTPVELRECISLSNETIERRLSKYPIRSAPYESIMEIVVLSTCNRLEMYAVVSMPEGIDENQDTAFELLRKYARDAFNLPDELIEPYLRRYAGMEVVNHLYRVTAGLDSIAIGETQILGQVARALELGLQSKGAGDITRPAGRHVLSSLFQAAIHTGKRVRSETEIGRRPISISSIAIQLAESTLGSLADRKILVIGAGKIGKSTIEALKVRQVQQIALANRTDSAAVEMAERLGGTAIPYASLVEGISDADIVFTSTAAPVAIIGWMMISEVMAERPDRPLMLIDLAVPRNVESRAAEIPNVQVFDMDDLQSFAREAATVGSSKDISRAEWIVADEAAEYEKLLQVIPFIGELHKKVEIIRQREVEKTMRYLHEPDNEVREQIELLSHSLVRKILHEPTMHLRTETNQETLNDYVDALSKLFDLSEDGEVQSLQNGEKWRL